MITIIGTILGTLFISASIFWMLRIHLRYVKIARHVALKLESVKQIHDYDSCDKLECMICSAIDCPFAEPLHYDKDGCPCCAKPSVIEKRVPTARVASGITNEKIGPLEETDIEIRVSREFSEWNISQIVARPPAIVVSGVCRVDGNDYHAIRTRVKNTGNEPLHLVASAILHKPKGL